MNQWLVEALASVPVRQRLDQSGERYKFVGCEFVRVSWRYFQAFIGEKTLDSLDCFSGVLIEWILRSLASFLETDDMIPDELVVPSCDHKPVLGQILEFVAETLRVNQSIV